MNLHRAATFPCNADKSPIPRRGFKDAIRGVDWRKAPLVGFPTGAVNGIDVLDIDGDAGREWYDANFDAIPATRAHSTRRGMHLLFRHSPGLRCTVGKIAPGIDVRAEDGYVIWWPREGLPVEDAPLCDWPDWLREEARNAQRSNRNRHSNLSVEVLGLVGVVDGILGELDPTQFRDHDRWLKLMMSCHAAGTDRETFIRWSTADPKYSGDGEVIRRRWDSLRADGGVSAAILLTEVRRVRAKTEIEDKTDLEVAVPLGASGRTIDVRRRTDGLIAWLNREPSEERLFRVACVFAEIVAEGRLVVSVATKLLEGGCPKLRKTLGREQFRETIANAFHHIEERILGERE
jgi:hypothetical protein